jgi:NAD-dependent dihydropyrimidine dehydrogenase PreA subunit
MKTIDPRRFSEAHAEKIYSMCRQEVARRIKSLDGFEYGVVLGADTDLHKIQTNGADLSPIGRGTRYAMPEDTGFVRSASYWKIKSNGYVWFDNGWNFFDDNWTPMGTCAWNAYKFKDAAVFSGDPTNTKEMQGRACQMIDLYPDKMRNAGVRYAVWSVLAYSGVKFSQAEDVFASLQVGKDPEKGKLFEPSRAMITFPLAGDYLTKFVCYIDFKTMEVCYMDFSFNGSVRSAGSNSSMLQRIMPAAKERLDNSVSVHDVFECVAAPVRDVMPSAIPIVCSNDSMVPAGEDRIVWAGRKTSQDAVYRDMDLNQILNLK